MIGHSVVHALACQLGLRIFNKVPSSQAPQDKNWYQIKSAVEGEAEKGLEVYVYGEIGAWGITANQFIQDLRAMDDGVSPITVAFNTIGGDLFEGLAIHNALNRLGERCTSRIDALAASAGSVAACGAHRIVMASNAMLMIHNPWTWAGGDAEDFRKVADVLDQTLEAIVASYKRKAPGIDDAELRQLIKDETWLPASEAKALGLCDEIIDGITVKAMVGDGGALRRYRNAPEALLAQLESPPAEPPVDPAPQDPPPQEPPPAPTNAAALAAQIIRGCAEAGISNLVEALTATGTLKDEASVKAAIQNAQAVRDLCVSARLPELAAGFVKDGLDADSVRARLFDKLVGNGFGEIINTPPPENDPPACGVKAVDPGAIYASRKPQASKGAHQ